MEDGPDGIENREYPRATTAAQAVVLARHNNGVGLTIVSLSLGGARLVGSISVDVGERVQILFEFDGQPVDVEGEVVRTESLDMATDHIAVRFVSLTSKAKESIRAMVDHSME